MCPAPSENGTAVAATAVVYCAPSIKNPKPSSRFSNSCTSPAPGDDGSCVDIGVTPGESYGILIKPVPYDPCIGDCVDNRYTLSVRLTTN